VADPKCRYAGQVDRAGFLRRPGSASRARAHLLRSAGECCSLGIDEELAVVRVGDRALEAAQCFELGLARDELAPVVGTTWGVVADLADRCDVDQASFVGRSLGQSPVAAD
jgi:hypothetical protein